MVFEENCAYGFRRNMYGMRPIGIAIALSTAVALGLEFYLRISGHERIALLAVILELVNVAMLAVWMFWVSEKAVRRGADLYAERLLEALDTVDQGT